MINRPEEEIFSVINHNQIDRLKNLLAKSNKNINIKNVYDETPLIIAAKNKHHDMVKMLIEAKADVNVQTKRRQTAILQAAYHGDAISVKFLIEAKAEVNH